MAPLAFREIITSASWPATRDDKRTPPARQECGGGFFSTGDARQDRLGLCASAVGDAGSANRDLQETGDSE